MSGRTPLIQAASLGREALVQVLLEVGAQRDAVDKDGRTARDLAIAGKHLAVVALLEGHDIETGRAMVGRGALFGRTNGAKMIFGEARVRRAEQSHRHCKKTLRIHIQIGGRRDCIHVVETLRGAFKY